MSWSVQIEGCESAEIACASRSKRSRIAGFSAWWPSNTLIATDRPSRVSFALYTSPIPPAPSGERISYGPRRVPGASGIVFVSAFTKRRSTRQTFPGAAHPTRPGEPRTDRKGATRERER